MSVFPEGFLWGGASAAVQMEGGNTNYTRELLKQRIADV